MTLDPVATSAEIVSSSEGTLSRDPLSRVTQRLRRLFPDRDVTDLERRVRCRLQAAAGRATRRFPVRERWSEQDLVLITYGDSLRRPGQAPLQVLREFLGQRLADAVGAVHVLPFFPSSSDDGFSVMDYLEVAPELGSWDDVEQLAARFDLMADLVANHASRQGRWFRGWAAGEGDLEAFFRTASPEDDLRAVIRPRTSPLLVPVDTVRGEEWAWATFSPDQMDLDYRTPAVVEAMVDVLATYLEHGARLVRLDAIAFVAKEVGTSCLHLPRTHEIVRLFRDVVEAVRPDAVLITETNVPHRENLSYLKSDEAHMVYQFALPPLVLHALDSGDASALTAWSATLPELPVDATFLNFTASHDGIGLRPLEGLIAEEEVDRLVGRMRRRGALVGLRTGPDGRAHPYELNVTLYDALADAGGVDPAPGIDRFLVSQAIMLALQGVPAVYVQSLFAGRGDREAVEQRGFARAINRRPWDLGEVDRRLNDPGDETAQVFGRLSRLMTLRRRQAGFHPTAPQKVLDLGPGLFTVLRTERESGRRLLAVHEVSGLPATIPAGSGTPLGTGGWHDVISGTDLPPGRDCALGPHQVRWLLEEPGQ